MKSIYFSLELHAGFEKHEINLVSPKECVLVFAFAIINNYFIGANYTSMISSGIRKTLLMSACYNSKLGLATASIVLELSRLSFDSMCGT